MRISDIFKKKKNSLSFEFFPPRSPDLEGALFETIESLKGEEADFASVTFGAGGSSAHKTLEWTMRIKESCSMATMMHLTCVGFGKEKLDDILEKLKDCGIENILALRGDEPKDANLPSGPREFPHASNLVEYISSKGGFCVGVAGYPEGHPEAGGLEKDIENLKIKANKGADFIITQLFFANENFYRFRDKTTKAGIGLPIIAGIMPIVNASQIIRFTKMCGASIPDALLGRISGRSEADVMEIGVEYAAYQCEDLIRNGAHGIHFYTLNRSTATKAVLERLDPFWK